MCTTQLYRFPAGSKETCLCAVGAAAGSGLAGRGLGLMDPGLAASLGLIGRGVGILASPEMGTCTSKGEPMMCVRLCITHISHWPEIVAT